MRTIIGLHPLSMALGFFVAGPLAAEPMSRSLPGYDFGRLSYSQVGPMDLKGGNGELEVREFDLRTLVSQPLKLGETWTILPSFRYALTSMDFADRPAALPLSDEDLHTLSLSSIALSMSDSSPWVGAIWSRVSLASDFQSLNRDALDLSLAGGLGYRFTPTLSFGLGVGVLNLNGDTKVYPGPVLDWRVRDDLRVGIYGPEVTVAWKMKENWMLSLRGEPGGGAWNFKDADGTSRTFDLSSYRVGLHLDRRLRGQLWLGAGAGMTFGNELRLQTANGRTLFKNDLDEGFFGYIGLRLNTW